MSTPIQQKIRDKKRTPKQIADMVKSGDWICHGSVGGDSTECTYAVSQRLGGGPGDLTDIEFWMYAAFYPHTELQEIDPKQEYHCVHEHFFFPWNRRARDENGVTDWTQWGWTLGMWYHHYRFAGSNTRGPQIDWWFNAATPPDKFGFFNWSYGTNNCAIFRQTAKNLVVEVREDYPWAEGGRFNTISIDDVDYWVEVDCDRWQWPQINERAIRPTSEEEKIAQHILGIIQDRDVIQLGIGSLPSACVAALVDTGLKDLGIHTEMLNYGIMRLIESGQVTNAYKSIDRGRSVWAFAFPVDTKWYYDSVHRNQNLAVYDIDYTNNYNVLTRIDNMIAIDNCVAIDLLGQQCCGFYDKRPISSSGGYWQFMSFCQASKGGRSVASMTSRSRHGTSRIVPFLPEGSSVDVTAQHTNYVCTEYGLVNLRGLSTYERVRALISIAHPDDREWLERTAYENGLLPPRCPINFGKNRRYPSYKERRNYKIPANSSIWGYDWDPVWSGK